MLALIQLLCGHAIAWPETCRTICRIWSSLQSLPVFSHHPVRCVLKHDLLKNTSTLFGTESDFAACAVGAQRQCMTHFAL